jgi:hypothetical protein
MLWCFGTWVHIFVPLDLTAVAITFFKSKNGTMRVHATNRNGMSCFHTGVLNVGSEILNLSPPCSETPLLSRYRPKQETGSTRVENDTRNSALPQCPARFEQISIVPRRGRA